ncbi:MAG: TIGR03960 family B12-binding radical SAM protein [Halanaerobiales bacterium]
MKVKEKIENLLYKVSNPERYIGNEWNQIKKDWESHRIKMALAFPDVYEIGMSHLGLRLIYQLINEEEDMICERCFAPWFDLEELMREKNYSLYALESGREIKDFDVFAFTLQYEMSYTAILNMLDLAEIPIMAEERDESYPLIIGGGATVYNPEPLAPFFDLFYIGEAEVGLIDLLRKYKILKKESRSRSKILEELSEIPGVYVPSFFQPVYNNGQFTGIKKVRGNKETVNRQIVKNLDKSFYPVEMIVPYKDIVHNRAYLEIARGCTHGCRFCAAGMSYRPVRERSKENLVELADEILQSTGYEEISLTSLSTADHSEIEELVKILAERYQQKNISISLPSLRVDEFSVELAREVQRVRKTGLTFAPEAGTQRLRDVINKGVKEENLYTAVRAAFNAGWHRIKLYFMIGLPTETEADLAGIVNMAKKVLKIGKDIRKNTDKKMKPIEVQVSVGTFVPKAFTPFQWVRMNDKMEIEKKQDYLRRNLRGRGLKFSWNDPELSLIEGLIARGDRRLASVIKEVWKQGSRFDGWSQHFKAKRWFEALEDKGYDLNDYLRERDYIEKLPWQHINMGIDLEFLQKECEKAYKRELTEDCRQGKCHGCNICFNFDVDLVLAGKEEGIIHEN